MESGGQLRQILYVSAGLPDLAPADIGQMFRTAQRNNSDNEVTGLLFHLEGSFLQILEGSSTAIDSTYRKIVRDRRHRRVMKLFDQEVRDRDFPDWRIGFQDIDGQLPPAQAAFLLTPQTLAEAVPPRAAPQLFTLARTFYRINRPNTLPALERRRG